MNKHELTYHEKLELSCHVCGAKRWQYCSGIPSMNEAVHHERGNKPEEDKNAPVD